MQMTPSSPNPIWITLPFVLSRVSRTDEQKLFVFSQSNQFFLWCLESTRLFQQLSIFQWILPVAYFHLDSNNFLRPLTINTSAGLLFSAEFLSLHMQSQPPHLLLKKYRI